MRRTSRWIDGDLFYDEQEYKISDLKTRTLKQDAAKATVEVTFKNEGEAKSLTFSLIKNKAVYWEFDDISTTEQGSMRKWVADGVKAAKDDAKTDAAQIATPKR